MIPKGVSLKTLVLFENFELNLNFVDPWSLSLNHIGP